jgi:hypothetical protein
MIFYSDLCWQNWRKYIISARINFSLSEIRAYFLTAVDFQPLFFEMGDDFLDHSPCSICGIGVPTSDISRQISFDLITEGKLEL